MIISSASTAKFGTFLENDYWNTCGRLLLKNTNRIPWFIFHGIFFTFFCLSLLKSLFFFFQTFYFFSLPFIFLYLTSFLPIHHVLVLLSSASFLPSFLPFFLPFFLPYLLSSFLHSFLPYLISFFLYFIQVLWLV